MLRIRALNRRQFLRRTAVGAPVSAWAAAAFLWQAGGGDAQLKAGFAERDITPDIGMEAPGGYGKAYHKTSHDPCKVRAAVFSDGRQQVAIVGVDALGIRREMVLKARAAITAKIGIAGDHILI